MQGCCSWSSGSVPIVRINRNQGCSTSALIQKSYNGKSRSRRWSEIRAGEEAGGVSWEIAVGAVAGVTPFVVAGIEFGKRIVKQRNCKKCKGSGLVLMDNKYYFRCPACGGFLPWQSWSRFFTG